MVPQLFLAFDDLKEKTNETLDIIANLSESGLPFGIKFNLDAMIFPGGNIRFIIEELSRFDRPLFADLKMWNGSRTMESVIKTFVDLGVEFVNVWAFADDQLEKAVKAAEGSNTKILGLTVLSHNDDTYCQKWFKRSLQQTVYEFSRFAVGMGCHGIILPGTTLNVVNDLQTIKVATGIRPEWYKDDRHKQEVTPKQAIRDSANSVVCGSPILKQSNNQERIKALEIVLKEMWRI